MPLITCLDCSKQISDSAGSCPECGRPQNGAGPPKRKVSILLGIGIVLLPFAFSWFTLRKGHSNLARIFSFAWLLIFIISSLSPSTPPSVSSSSSSTSSPSSQLDLPRQPAVEVKAIPEDQPLEFSFTIDQFIERYNSSAETVDSDIRLSLKSRDDNGEFITAQLESNRNVAVIVRATQQTQILQSVTFLASGDGTFGSGADVIIGSAAFVMAIENPNMPLKDRSSIFKDLGYTDDDVDIHDRVAFVRDDISYTKTYSDEIGLFLTAEPK